jgi:hypothetical protein
VAERGADRRSSLPTVALGIGTGIASLAVAAAILHANRMFFHDDAFITLRYARNFLAGNGLVWNPGEFVQGYTNFLFLLIVIGISSVGVDLVDASRIVGGAAWLLLVTAVFALSRRGPLASPDHPLSGLATVLVATSAPLIVWSIGGLEGTLFVLFSTLAMGSFAGSMRVSPPPRRLAASAVWFGLAFFTRPEGALFFAICFAVLMGVAKEGRARHLAVFGGTFAALVAPYLVWQLLYYGDVLPNTFYVKAGGFTFERALRGVRYLWRYVGGPPYLVLALVPAAVAAARTAALDRVVGLFVGSSALYLLYVVYVGGDHMHAARLVLPVIPLLAISLQRLLVALFPDLKAGAAAALYTLVLGLSLLQLGVRPLSPGAEDNASFMGRVIGAYIAQAWPPDSLIALNSAGAVPYFGEGHRYLDMLGLTDRHIARTPVGKRITHWQAVPGHAKGDGDYVLSREPDYIIVGPAEGTRIETPWFLSEVQMLRDPRFRASYRLRREDLSGAVEGGEGVTLTWYERRR